MKKSTSVATIYDNIFRRILPILNWENETKYEGLPRGCWNCKYLSECRRPKEEGWKCYNGCRVIKEKNQKTKQLKPNA